MIVIKKWNGKKITEPGIYADIPMEMYHGDICDGPAISSSGMRRMMTSPAHYWDCSPYNPNREEDDSSKSIILGRMAHHLLFGEDHFAALFVQQPERTPHGDPWHHARPYCKAWKKRQNEQGKTIFTKSMIDIVKGMADALSREPLVQAGILNGEIERSWFWKDKETGIWLKVRPDATPTDSLDFADLKTAKSVEEEYLRYAIGPRGYGYYQQGALAGMACQALLGVPMNSFSFVFIESARPYCVETVTLKDHDIALGVRANRYAIRQFVHGIKTGEWPGPSGGRRDARYIEIKKFDHDEVDHMLRGEGF